MTTTRDLADERFVSLTTYRRSGAPVATPVWIAVEGGSLVAITPAATGKVRRLRRDARVELRPCDRRGRVEEGAVRRTGTATVLDDAEQVDRIRDRMRAKYGWEYRVFMAVEALARRTLHTPRLGLRLELDDAG